MKSKNIVILSLVAAGLAGAAYFLGGSSRPSGAKLNGKAILPDLDVSKIARVDCGKLALAARLAEPTTGRVLEVWTTEPGMQTYACNKMPEGGRPTKGGKRVCVHGAVAFETQHHPDSPNRPEFPGVVLNPGDEFRSTTEYRFRAQ